MSDVDASGTRSIEDLQRVVFETARGRVVAVDSAYDVRPVNRDRDVVVNASYSGVLPARFLGACRPRAAIGVDCAVGLDGAGIAGLWYLEALGVPAAAADVSTVILGDGVAMYEMAVVSYVNAVAAACGVSGGMTVREAAARFLEAGPVALNAEEVTNRTVVYTADDGRSIVCTDSIAFGLDEDRGHNVLCTAGHTGRSSAHYIRRVAPLGFICSDGGRGRDDSGMAGLAIVGTEGIAGATVDARTARMGDGLSTYHDGQISACNAPAEALGVVVGQPAREAARLLLLGDAKRS